MIISASRRTDIPAFYTPWFINRVREGFLLVRNPFNAHQVRRVSLQPEDVDAIVFWTRNAESLIDHFPLLNDLGYKYYFQYTITGYPRTLEKSVPKPLKSIETFSRISDVLGAGRIIWRYDPILLSNVVDVAEHKRLFSKIAGMLQGKTRRVMVSFADFYKKTEKNLQTIERLNYRDIVSERESLLDLSQYMREVAASYGMEIQTCSERIDLSGVGIGHGKCIDDGLLETEFGLNLQLEKDKGQREECGCVKSVDIGQYNTCAHGCAYCYANFNNKIVVANKQKHDPTSPFLIGSVEGADDYSASLHESEKQSKLF